MATKTLRRTLPRILKNAVQAYGKAVGELVWASNDCLNYFALMYRELFDNDHINIAVRTWHTQRSDRGQLNLLEAAVLGNRALNSTGLSGILRQVVRDEILWTIAKALDLSEKRNDAVHSATRFVILPGKRIKLITSSISTLPSRVARLSKQKSLIRHFNIARNDYLALTAYVYHLWQDLVSPGQQPLPKRPRPRSV